MTDELTLVPGAARRIISLAPCAVVLTDRDARVLYCNPRFALWCGREQGEIVGKRLSDLFDVAGRIYCDTHMLPMLYIQGFVREIQCNLKNPDGRTVPILLNGNLEMNTVTGEEEIIFTALDTTERAQYEAELRRARDGAEELAAIVESSLISVLRLDANGAIKRWNPASVRMFGLDEATAAGQSAQDLLDVSNTSDWLTPHLKEACASNETVFFKEATPDGRHLHLSVTPIPDQRSLDGTCDFSLLIRDITKQVQAEHQVDIMMRELNHRVKNNLAVVVGIARQTFRSASTKAETTKFIDRISALSAAHDLLVDNNWDSTSLTDVVKLTTGRFDGESRLSVEGPDISLPAQSVAMTALALFELMTNAIKYGALKHNGTVRLKWWIEGSETAEPRFVLTWDEQSDATITPPTREGFGRQLIETLIASELNGETTLEFAPDGLKYRLEAPYWDAATRLEAADGNAG
ncbi:sensor histidine kinase [Gymnodinialimonas ceratoperidinii]|uniref:histidine kinase n=1 Tax=Gymnodinialimonas ceratoperidinii TaxID=2856823 RepID=A0A8F6YBN0_9RHOB|nr:HWE histidine kinase domain-containing protein [Gymnodinialimonas ceratoperidinii]QXT40733.1 PAS domain S-box protein [Gymnodinialimonas ceratoperidinii]